NREIDRDLGGVQGRVVLGVQVARVLLYHERRLAFAQDLGCAEIDAVAFLQLRQPRVRLGARQQHRVAKVASGARIRQQRGDQDALVDLVSLFVTLQKGGLRRDLLARRGEARNERRGVIDELLDPDEARAVPRQPVVKRFRVGGEKDAARVPRRLLHLLGRWRLLRFA